MTYHVQFPALGLEFTVNRVAFSIFGLNIYWYGVIITLGIVLCVMLGLKLGKYYKLNEDDFIDVIMVSAFWALSVPGFTMLYLLRLNMRACWI